MALDVTVGAGVVRVVGEVDLDTSPDLLRKLGAALGASPELEVDLSRVDYIDSSGVAVLVQALKQANRNGRKLALRDPSPRVLAVLELAELHRLFEIRRSEAE